MAIGKLEEWIVGTKSPDFTLRHQSYHQIKTMKEQSAVPFVLEALKDRELPEEDILRLLDILASLGPDAAVVARGFLRKGNPYLVRGELMALALSGGEASFRLILEFAAGRRNTLVRRDLFGETVGYMLEKDPGLQEVFDEMAEKNPLVRGYFRGMEVKGPAYGRLTVYPSNDYWALKAREKGLDYERFKETVEGKVSHK